LSLETASRAAFEPTRVNRFELHREDVSSASEGLRRPSFGPHRFSARSAVPPSNRSRLRRTPSCTCGTSSRSTRTQTGAQRRLDRDNSPRLIVARLAQSEREGGKAPSRMDYELQATEAFELL